MKAKNKWKWTKEHTKNLGIGLLAGLAINELIKEKDEKEGK